VNEQEVFNSLFYYDLKGAEKLFTIFKSFADSFLLPVFIISLIIEFFGDMDFKGVVVRLFVALILINFFKPVHFGAKNLGFEVSKSITTHFGGVNKILSGWSRANRNRKLRRSKSEIGIWEYYKTTVQRFPTDAILTLLWAFNLISLFVIKLLYSLVFHFTYAFIPVTALIAIFPPFKNAVLGPIKALVWVFLVPVLASSLIAIAGDVISPANFKNGYVVYDFKTYLQLFSFSFLLLTVCAMARKIVSGEGFQEIAAANAKTMGLGLTALAFKWGGVRNPAARMARWGVGKLGSMSKSGITKPTKMALSGLSSKADDIRGRTAIAPNFNTLKDNIENSPQGLTSRMGEALTIGAPIKSALTNGPSRSVVKGHKNKVKDTKKLENIAPVMERSPSQKVMMAADSLFNAIPNRRARKVRENFVKENTNPKMSKFKVPLSAFKSPRSYQNFLSERGIPLNSAPKINFKTHKVTKALNKIEKTKPKKFKPRGKK
jgi:hypothetical protein